MIYKFNKYKNTKINIDGISFDSKKEAKRYNELKLLEKLGKIKDLELQKKYVLLPSQPKKDGLRSERECSYHADFSYTIVDTGRQVVEDVKGMKTEVYKIKRKLFKYFYGMDIYEI